MQECAATRYSLALFPLVLQEPVQHMAKKATELALLVPVRLEEKSFTAVPGFQNPTGEELLCVVLGFFVAASTPTEEVVDGRSIPQTESV